MDDRQRLEAKGLARAKIRGRRRRVREIRRRTIRGSLALFAIVWAIVFGQLVTGNDPALSRGGQATRRSLAATDRTRSAETEPGSESGVAPEPAYAPEPEIAPEPEYSPEPEVTPEPEPVVTSAS